MTETQLFKRAAAVLASTLAIPVIVILTTSGGSNAVKQRLASYLGGATNVSAQTNKDGSEESEMPETVMDKDTEASKPDESMKKEEGSEATYTVKEGDTYGCIAEKHYGSYDQWQKVYAANAGYLGYDEYELHVGAKIVMPALANEEIKTETNLCN